MIGISFAISFTANLTAMIFPGAYAALFTERQGIDRPGIEGHAGISFRNAVFRPAKRIQPTFLALGQAKISLFIAMFRKVILLVPLALVLPRFFGVMGIYYAEPISDIISAATAGILFCINIKKNSVERISGKNPMRE